MAIFTDENDDRIGLYYALDKHDYDNLPLEKVRLYATDARFNPAKDKWEAWSTPDGVDIVMIKAQDYLFTLLENKKNT